MNGISNYWSDKILFREKIQKELLPFICIKYLGQVVENSVLDKIRTDIISYLDKCKDKMVWFFDCEVKLECEKGEYDDVITEIDIFPIDI